MLSYKTSNNQEIINKLPYYQFANMLVFLEEILDIENGKHKKTDEDNNQQESVESLMRNARNLMGKMPNMNLKLPKIK